MRKEVLKVPVGEHGRGIYTPLPVRQGFLPFYTATTYSSYFANLVLRHMGIDRPAPGTGYVFITPVTVVILLIRFS